MNTIDIERALNIVPHFKGVFAADDRLPIARPSSYVINTDKRGDPGEHWVGIYVDNEGRGEYFDSYGLPPLSDNTINNLNNACVEWTYNRQQLQSLSPLSTTCGPFVILFIILKTLGIPTEFLNIIFNDFKTNDSNVIHILKDFAQNIIKDF